MIQILKTRPWLLLMATAVLLLLIVASVFIYTQVRDLGSGALAVLLGNVVLKVISIYLLVFLFFLVCRYLFMML